MPETKENGEAAVSQESSCDTTQDEVVNEQELKYWKAVKENPADFTSWTYLLQFVEQEVCIKHFYFCSDLHHLETAVLHNNSILEHVLRILTNRSLCLG